MSFNYATKEEWLQRADSLIVLANKGIDGIDGVKDAVEKADLHNVQGVDAMLKAVGVLDKDINSMKAELVKHGYTIETMMYWTKEELLAALNKIRKDMNKQFNEVKSQNNRNFKGVIAALKAGQITLEQAKAELKEINEKLANIEMAVIDIASTLSDFVSEYKQDKKDFFGILKDITRNQRTQIAQSGALINLSYAQLKRLDQISANTDSLINIANDETRYNKFINDIKNTNPNSIDYKKLEEMFKLLNMNLQQAANLSREEFKKLITDFKNTYVKTEAEQTKIMQEIANSISNPFINVASLEAKIDAVVDAINSDKDTVASKIDDLRGDINTLIAAVNKLAKDMNNQFTITN